MFCICVFRGGLVCTNCVTYLLLFNGNCWKIPFSWFMMIFKPVLLLKVYWRFLYHLFWFWKVLNFAIELDLKERFVHSKSWLKKMWQLASKWRSMIALEDINRNAILLWSFCIPLDQLKCRCLNPVLEVLL